MPFILGHPLIQNNVQDKLYYYTEEEGYVSLKDGKNLTIDAGKFLINHGIFLEYFENRLIDFDSFFYCFKANFISLSYNIKVV